MHHILPALGAIALEDLRPRHVRDFIAKLRAKTSRRGVPFAPRSVRAAMLAAWWDTGWQRAYGRRPQAEDLIVPTLAGKCRADPTLRELHADLAMLGLRPRRVYDLRRTFISLAQVHGARGDILRWVTHGGSTSIMDLYTTIPWEALCEAVACMRISR